MPLQDNGDETTGRIRPVVPFTRPVFALIYWSAVAIFSTVTLALFAALLVNVILRYAFGEGIIWAYEIPAILFPWAAASAAVVAAVLGRNIQVAVLVRVLPQGIRRIVGITVYAATAVVSLTVIWTATPTLKASQFMRLAETGIPQIWGMSSLIYAFAAIALIAVLELLLLIAGAPYLDDQTDQSLS